MSSKPLDPDDREELDKMKMEVAQELGVNLHPNTHNYLGNLPPYDTDMSGNIENAGNIGGDMVRRMIEESERRLAEEKRKKMKP